MIAGAFWYGAALLSWAGVTSTFRYLREHLDAITTILIDTAAIALIYLVGVYLAKLWGSSEVPHPIRTEPIALAAVSDRRVTPVDGRIVVTIAPAKLLEMYKNNTAAAGNRLIQPYLEKWLSISGVVWDVDHDDKKRSSVFIRLNEDQDIRGVLRFEPEWYDHVSILGVGSHVDAVGQLKAAENSIRLENCELVQR